MASLGIPANTIAVLQKHGFQFQKKYGQNFLIDTHVLDKIIIESEITADDCDITVECYALLLLHILIKIVK